MELFNEDKIPKRTLGEVVILDNTITSPSIVNGSFLGGSITIGSGENVFRVDRNGIYLGSSSFATAPFRVDMQGNLVASSARIAGDIVSDNYVEGVSGYKLEYETGNAYLGNAIISGSSIIGDNNVLARTIGSSINQSGQFIKDVVNTNLSTATKQILGDFTFGSYGAIKMITDDNNGVWLSPTGILGKKAGATTFTIGADGNATFSGNVIGATITGSTITGTTITGATITGATITGGTIQTATSGSRVVLKDSGFWSGQLVFYYGDDASPNGQIYAISNSLRINNPTSGGAIQIGTADGLSATFFGTSILAKTISPSGSSENLGSSSYKWNNLYVNIIRLPTSTTDIVGDIIPTTNGTVSGGQYLGSSSYKWYDVNSFFGTFDYLGKNLNANTYNITNAGTIGGSNVDIASDGYIKRGGTNYIRLLSNAIDCYRGIGLLATSTPPSNAYNGLMFYHTTYHEVWVYKNGAWKALAYVS